MLLQAHGPFLALSHQPWAQSQLQRQQLTVWAASGFLPWQEGQGASWKRLWAGSSPSAAPHGLFIALCLQSACSSASSWVSLETFNLGNLPLQDRAGMVLGHSARSHMQQLQQELRRAERAVPALLPSSSPGSCSQPQGLDVPAEPGHRGCSPWLGSHPHVPAARDPKTIPWGWGSLIG